MKILPINLETFFYNTLLVTHGLHAEKKILLE